MQHTVLKEQSYDTLVQIIDHLYSLFQDIAAYEQEAVSPVESVGLAPAVIEPIASSLDVLTTRNSEAVSRDPLLAVGMKVHKTFMLAVGFAKDPHADAIQIRIEALWICAAVLFELYQQERKKYLVTTSPKTNLEQLESVFFSIDLVDHMRAVEDLPCENLAETNVPMNTPGCNA